MHLSELLQLAMTGVTVGSVYALVALGFTVIYSATRIINFAQGEFVVLGGLLFYSLHVTGHVSLVPALLASVAAVAVIGLMVERLAIRPLLGKSPVTLIIITIAVSVILRGAAKLVWGPDSLSVPTFTTDRSIFIGGAALRTQYIWVMGLAALAVVGVRLFFDRTLVGKAMQACAVNPDAARGCGISVERMVQASFALSAGLSALAGVAIAPITFASYDGGGVLGLKGFCGAVVGGLGNGVGAVCGGLFIGLIENIAVGFAPSGYSGYKDAFAFLVLLLVLLLRPSGLFGRQRAEGV